LYQVLRSDYYSLQSDSTQRRTALEGELEHIRDKLTTYEQLEHELDVAILQAGQSMVVKKMK
jgi:hypothetical protein